MTAMHAWQAWCEFCDMAMVAPDTPLSPAELAARYECETGAPITEAAVAALMPENATATTKGNLMPASERTAAEKLHVGDIVQAVECGPRGVVILVDHAGWTIVEYHRKHSGGIIGYQHGREGLYVVTSRTRGSGRTGA